MKGWAGLLLACVALTGCDRNDGSPPGPLPRNDAGSEPSFSVPSPPASYRTADGLNQTPRPDDLAPELVRRVAGRPEPLSDAQRQAAESRALTLAREWLAGSGFGPDADASVMSAVPDEYGSVHVKFTQMHRGVPVLDTGLIAHLYPDLDDEVTANVVAGLAVDVQPTVTEADARDTALARYGAATRTVPLETAVRLGVLPRFELVRTGTSRPVDHTDDFQRRLSDARLVWEVVVGPPEPDVDGAFQALLSGPLPPETDDDATEASRRANGTRGGVADLPALSEDFTTIITTPAVRYRIDARTGDVLEEEVLVQENNLEPRQGTGWGYFNGRVVLDTAYSEESCRFVLSDIRRPLHLDNLLLVPPGFRFGNVVWDARGQETYNITDMFLMTDGNNNWGDASIINSEISPTASARYQTPAVDVAYGVQITWDFLDNVLSRWGPAGNGTPTRACVHYGDGYADAHYNGASRFICFGDGEETDQAGIYFLHFVGHELGHAFWHAAGIGGGKGEAGALNEGNGDILGGLVDLYEGTGAGTGSHVRRFPNFSGWMSRVVDPASYSRRDDDDIKRYGMPYWTSFLKDRPVHVGGLPYGRMFVYLAEGAPDDASDTLYTSEYPQGMGGIGIVRAAHIWKTAVAYYLAGKPTYQTMRTAFVSAAKYLYGPGSMEHRAVRRAFAAIRVGSGPADLQPPVIDYAQIYAVNSTDMTALAYAKVRDNAGLRAVNITGSARGTLTGDYLLGYVSILDTGAGQRSATFSADDGAGQTTSTTRNFLVTRSRNLIRNGGFESGLNDWTAEPAAGALLGTNAERAFLGSGYVGLQGDSVFWQEVSIPAQAKDVTLVFRLLTRDATRSGDMLRAQVRDPSGVLLEELQTYGWLLPPRSRSWLNKGYVRQAFDLSAYAGQTIRIAFQNSTAANKRRFLLDHVVLSYAEEPDAGLPEVTVREWENTVTFRLPDLQGVEPEEVGSVHYYVDGQPLTFSEDPLSRYFAASFLDALGPGTHWVAARVRGLDNQILVDSPGVWFHRKPYHELLVNGGFELGAWDLGYSDPPPRIQIVEDGLDVSQVFDGERSLLMGGQGGNETTTVGQAVQMPKQMKSLDFGIRVRVLTEEDSEANPAIEDRLWLEFRDQQTYEPIVEYMLAEHTYQPTRPGTLGLFAGYYRVSMSLPTALLAGRNVLVRLQTRENGNNRPTWFYVDNASLRYSQFSLSLFQGN